MQSKKINTKKLVLSIALLIGFLAAHAQSPHAAQLYGMTQYGGPEHKGSIFHFTPSTQAVTIDYNFQIKVKGKAPKCELTAPGNGKYYGTTTLGGANNEGVIFEWDSLTGNYAEVYDFTNIDGGDARGGMAFYNGKLYGMTSKGGVGNFGVIYEWDFVTNIYTKKIDLDSINGKNPTGILTLLGGVFYGFTYDGGLQDKGVLFEWNPTTNVYTKKYDFDGTNGSHPVGKLVAFNNMFYAMTDFGGVNNKGVIYEWNQITNIVTKKIDFNGLNGAHPQGYLTMYNNKFYGITYEGGVFEDASPDNHYGVIFEWNPVNNVFLKKKDLGASNQHARGSLSSLTLKGNEFWGIGADGISKGAIFLWNPSTNIIKDYFFNDSTPWADEAHCSFYAFSPGKLPFGNLILSGNKLLGTSSSRGGAMAGCIFEYFPDSNQITRSVHMQAADGSNPRGSLSRVGNKLFGLTNLGGNNHCGDIFEWNLSTQQFTERFKFDGYYTGIQPVNSLTWLNGKFYGINRYGKGRVSPPNAWAYFGIRLFWEIFSWDPLTSDFQSLYNFGYGGITLYPLPCSLIALNNKLYGTGNGVFVDTVTSITHNAALFQFDPVTNTHAEEAYVVGGTYSNYQQKESANGLTEYNGKLYGMTPAKGPSGNINFKGTIFEWDTTTNLTTIKYDFVDSIGSYPTGDLVLVDSVFYGLTTGAASGGENANGSLFKWNPTTNVIEKKYNVGGTGTPTYCEGKLYYLIGNVQPTIVEYDPVLDTAYYHILSSYGAPFYEWFDFLCDVNSYQKLLEVIPNKDPLLSNIPTTQTVCSNQINTATFTIDDADLDTMSFQISSSNASLIPVANISVSNVNSVYTISYSSIANQTGFTTLSFIADDGYGGSVNFSFIVNVSALPNVNVTQNGETLNAQQDGETYQWINCNGNTAILGETNQSYTTTANGNYAVIITSANGCSDTSACFAITIVGISESDLKNAISISPNPVQDFLNINISSNQNIIVKRLTIKNIIGQTVYMDERNFLQTNVSNISTGIYIVELITDKGNWIEKIVKQ